MLRLFLLIGLLYPFVGLSAAPDNWSEYAQEVVADGNIYRIHTPQQLAWIALCCNASTGANSFAGKEIVLQNNIDLSGREWIPIANNNTHPFAGVFDGREFTISGMTISLNAPSSTTMVGLVGFLSGGRIERVVLSNPAIAVVNQPVEGVGTLAGCIQEIKQNTSPASPARITGCVVSGASIRCTLSGSSLLSVGGVVGRSFGGYVGQCSTSGLMAVTASVTGPMSVGGICGGGSWSAAIDKCRSGMNLSLLQSSRAGHAIAGGILGQQTGGGITNCESTGAVRALHSGAGTSAAGGIVGIVDSKSVVKECSALNPQIAAVSVSSSYVGRIASQPAALSSNKAFAGMVLLNYSGSGTIPSSIDPQTDSIDLTGCTRPVEVSDKGATTKQGSDIYRLTVSTTGEGGVELSSEGLALPRGGYLEDGSRLTVLATPAAGATLQSLTLNHRPIVNGSTCVVGPADAPSGSVEVNASFAPSASSAAIEVYSDQEWSDARNEGADLTVMPSGRLKITGPIATLGRVTVVHDLRQRGERQCGELDASTATELTSVESVVLEFWMKQSTENAIHWNGVALPAQPHFATITDGMGHPLVAVAPDRLQYTDLADSTRMVSMTYDGAGRAEHGLVDPQKMNNWRHCLPLAEGNNPAVVCRPAGELIATRASVIRITYTGREALALLRATEHQYTLTPHTGAAQEEHWGWNLLGNGLLTPKSLGMFSQVFNGAGYVTYDDRLPLPPFAPAFIKTSPTQTVGRNYAGSQTVGIELIDRENRPIDRSYIVIGGKQEHDLPKMTLSGESCQWFDIPGRPCCVVYRPPATEIELPLYVRAAQADGPLSLRLSRQSEQYTATVNGEPLTEGTLLRAREGGNRVRLEAAMPTSLTNTSSLEPVIVASKSGIRLENLPAGTRYRILSIAGTVVYEGISEPQPITISLPCGVYVVHAGGKSKKVCL